MITGGCVVGLGLSLMLSASCFADGAATAKTGVGAAPACQTCHGQAGEGLAQAGFPRLAGLGASYLQRQLDSFADGTRDNAVMVPMAKALSEDERHALAEYYSRLPIPPAAAKGTAPPANDALGEQLATRGRWNKQVPGCVAPVAAIHVAPADGSSGQARG